MKILIDAYVVSKIKEDPALPQESGEIVLGWPGLLEFLGYADLAKSFPAFTKEDSLYREIVVALESKTHPELLEHLFDQVFVKCLNWVRSKPEFHPTFLANAIRDKKGSEAGQLLLKPLNHYEQRFLEHPYHTIHDLTLYLAWDRVCVDLAIVFEYPGTSDTIKQGLTILKECLVESFQHITSQKKTVPGFFRLMEALYALQMREERLQTYSDAEWQILCESSQALRSREEFLDVPYIDGTLFNTQVSEHLPLSAKALTMDTWEKVNKSLVLARHTIDTLKSQDLDWHFELQALETICLS